MQLVFMFISKIDRRNRNDVMKNRKKEKGRRYLCKQWIFDFLHTGFPSDHGARE